MELSASIVVAKPKAIDHEWRLFVAGGDVVAGSHYRERGRLAVSPHVPEEVRRFGAMMAERFQPAAAFVLDIAAVADSLKVIEINGINSSGFYASDVRAVVAALSALAA